MSKRKHANEQDVSYDINKKYLKKVKQTTNTKENDAPPENVGNYHCNYCKKDLSNQVRIKCAKCIDFDLCVDCFFVGVETQQHKCTHPYRVMDNMSTPIFTSLWGADEELLLLEGIEMFGLGNWIDVADHVGSKNRFECEYHYWSIYVDRPFAKRREMLKQQVKTEEGSSTTITEGLPSNSSSSSTHNTTNTTVIPQDHYIPIPDIKAPIYPDRLISKKEVKKDDDGVLRSIRDELGLPNFDLSKIFEENKKRCKDPRHLMGSILSKEPKFVGKGRTQHQVGSEVGYLPLRTDFEVEYDNAAEEDIAEVEILDTDTPEEREKKLNALRLYDFKLSERERRKQFAIERGLYDWKKISEKEKKRTKIERELFQKYRPFARFLDSQEEFEQFMNGIIQETKIKKRIQQLKEYRDNGLVLLDQCDIYENDLKKRESEIELKRARDQGSSSTKSFPKRIMDNLTGTPKDLVYPGVECLSKREKEFCASLELYPKHYMVMKDCLMRESFQNGFISKTTAFKLLSDLDKSRANKLFDFLLSSGWISGSLQQQQLNGSSK